MILPPPTGNADGYRCIGGPRHNTIVPKFLGTGFHCDPYLSPDGTFHYHVYDLYFDRGTGEILLWYKGKTA